MIMDFGIHSSVFPFGTIFYPDKLGEIIQGIMVNPYKERLAPRMVAQGIGTVIGSNSACSAEAILKLKTLILKLLYGDK